MSSAHAGETGSTGHGGRGRLRGLLGAALLAVLVPWFACGTATDRVLHGDETYWVWAGYRATRLAFVERDFSNEFWTRHRDRPVLTVQRFTTLNPKLGMYLLGIPILALDAPPPRPLFYDFHRSARANREQGRVPPPQTVRAARLSSAAMGVLAGLLFYGLLCALLHPLWAFAGALLLAANPLVHLACVRAMVDAHAFAFSIGAMLAAVAALRRPERWGAWAWLGLSAGAAVSCKQNAAILLPILAGAVAIEAALRRSVALLARAGAAGALAFALFVATNPTLYREPVTGLVAMAGFGSDVGAVHRFAPRFALASVAERLGAARGYLFGEYAVFGSHLGVPVDAALLLLGIGVLGARARRAAAARLVLLWLAVALLSVALWPPARWPRYFLPAVAPLAAVEWIGLAVALEAGLRRARRLQHPGGGP